MFKNYFKTAWRNLTRNKVYSFINIAGLAIGIAVCMMIFLIIQYQNSFDNFHKKKDHIYRLLTEFHHADSKDIFTGHGVPFGIPNSVKTAFPQVIEVAPLFASHSDQMVIQDNTGAPIKKFKEQDGIFYTEPSFFKIFDFPLLSGSYKSLDDPNNVLLSMKTADKYFGDWKNATGKTIRLNNDIVLKVSGVLASIPANTDFQFKAVISYGTGYTQGLKTSTDNDGVNQDFGCYILLPKNIKASTFEKQLRAYSAKVKSPDDKDQVTMQPLADVHYDTKAGTFSNNGISHTMINILWLIASFILLIACVNFINLSTAQAVNRAKEVGVRKVLGSNKSQLRLQFISETFLIVFASVMAVIILAVLAIPFVNNLLELSIKINASNAMSILVFLFLIIIAVTGIAGFYPSVVLSKFNPINALKSKLAVKSTKGISLRRGLVVFQFITAQVLIIGTLVILKQMNFFLTQPLGFDKNAIVNIPLPTDSLSKIKYDFVSQKKQRNKQDSIATFWNRDVFEKIDSWYLNIDTAQE